MADTKYPNKIPGLSDEEIDANAERGRAMGADGSEARGFGILREDGPSGAAAMRKKLGTAKPKTRLQTMQP